MTPTMAPTTRGANTAATMRDPSEGIGASLLLRRAACKCASSERKSGGPRSGTAPGKVPQSEARSSSVAKAWYPKDGVPGRVSLLSDSCIIKVSWGKKNKKITFHEDFFLHHKMRGPTTRGES